MPMPDVVCLNGRKCLDTLTPQETSDMVPGRGPVGSAVRASCHGQQTSCQFHMMGR